MFRHNLVLFYRSALRARSSFIINLVGLSTGLACALLIYLWVADEFGMDKFHEKNERLYQVMHNVPDGENGILTIEGTPGPLGKTLLDEIPEIEDVSVIDHVGDGVISVGNNLFEASGLFVPANFFNTFSYELVDGNKEDVLREKLSILLSDELALKLFHTTENVIGKTIHWNKGEFSGPYIVSGIFKKPSRSSSAQFDLLLNYQVYFDRDKEDLQSWGSSGPRTYVILKEGTNPEKVSKKIEDYIRAKRKAANSSVDLKYIGTLFLQRYSDKYLYNHYENGAATGGRISYVKMFSLIAVFILLIACINFINLSTAKASIRIKEIGIKKAMGAQRRTMILQFLSESMLLTFLALILALTIVTLSLSPFNFLTGKDISLGFDANILTALLTITLLTGLISGSYPAFYLSQFKSALALKGKLNTSVSDAWVRRGLVIFQFAVSVILIISVVVVYMQVEFIQSKNLGYNKDNIISFQKEGQLNENLETFIQEVKKLPGVANASTMGGNMSGQHGGTFGLDWEGKNAGKNVDFGILGADYDLIETLDLKLTQGRSFSRKFGSESSNIIFNEAAIRAMGLKDPVGKRVKVKGKDKQIIGVVRDFHYQSLHEKIKPLFIQCSPNEGNILVKINKGKEKSTIQGISLLYKQFNQGLPFEFRFLDEEYQALYAAEQRVAVLSGYFAVLAIIISCLGLLGLAAFTTARRRKEIGVRKVIGASVLQITLLLNRDFVVLVLLSICIGFPIAMWATNSWLAGFAYKASIGWWLYALAALSALFIALVTVSFQAIKAALADPAESLRTE